MCHFLPIHVDLMGIVDFTQAKLLANKKRQEAKKEAAEKEGAQDSSEEEMCVLH